MELTNHLEESVTAFELRPFGNMLPVEQEIEVGGNRDGRFTVSALGFRASVESTERLAGTPTAIGQGHGETHLLQASHGRLGPRHRQRCSSQWSRTKQVV